MERKVYLEALKISEGQISIEKIVRLKDYTEKETSGFFENAHIKSGMLEVRVLSEEGSIVLVKLPGRTLEAPGDKGYLWVKKDDLKYVA